MIGCLAMAKAVFTSLAALPSHQYAMEAHVKNTVE